MLIENLKSVSEQYPEKTALIYENYRISYANLKEISDRLANGLINCGIAKGDRVGVMLPNVPHFVFVFIALLKISAVVVPVNYMLFEDDLNHELRNAQLKAIVYWDGFRKLLKTFFLHNASVTKIILGNQKKEDNFQLEKLIKNYPVTNLENSNQPEEVAVIQYTSGLNDIPIGVELTHENIAEKISTNINFFKLTGNHVFGVFMPLFLMTVQNDLMNTALSLGATMILHSKIDLAAITKSIDENHVSVITASPQFYQMLFNWEDEFFSGASMDLNLSSHANLSDELAEKFKKKFHKSLLNCYSITEAGGIVSSSRLSFDYANNMVGNPLPGFEIQIHNINGQISLSDEIGAVAIRGKALFKQYWQNPELTKQRFHDGWFYSGDLGRINLEGNLQLIERNASIITKGGFQIFTSEIEDLLISHPKIKEAAILSVPHPDHKEEVMACLQLKLGETMTGQEVIAFCREHFPVYKCPQVVKFYHELPRTKMGKIFKRKLKQDIERK